MPKTQQTAWTIGLTSVVVDAAVALVTINDERPEARNDPPPAPQVFRDVITVANLLDTVPIVADPTSMEEWPDQAHWQGTGRPATSERGCDVKTTALAAALEDVTFRPGSADYIVAQGSLHDPYTGLTVEYDSASGNRSVSVDHIHPLNTAWVLGASTWAPEQQSCFVNDVQRNLIVADARAVGDRANRGLAQWLPPSQNFACTFAAKYLRVAQAYDLPITRGDAIAAAQVCGLSEDAGLGSADTPN
ncbi:GmrSD restriction endonuclease domain-containing protein [Rhodococcus sp. EPR-157]|uniref:GmrSD restriction endonuclease domain-containing protein n=1 Tax=Rhodococcus sp. EPR-157 TaxID=1813677 RepID=UPI0012E7ABB1|nr:DUF1524 domain-containing protein [Rhodococcus sp. EPR-157]